MAPALAFKDLSLSIAGKAILDKVSFSLPAGKITGLVGRSGSGKSMTGLAAMGLAPAQAKLSGEIILNERNLVSAPEKDLCAVRGRDIAMVFQEPMTALNPLHSIGAQVAETILTHTATTRKAALTKAADVLARVGLPPKQISPARLPHELSGGQRQRVVIAIAIAMKPKVLIADEPTTSLDVTTQAEILSLLRSLTHEDGMALLLITHDLAVIGDMADHVAVMKAGRIVAQDTPETFFTNGANEDVRELLAAPLTRATLKTSDDSAPTVLQTQDVVCAYNRPRRSLFTKRERFHAVDGVSMSIRAGENVGLVGESGCGKSTFARALLGLKHVAAGAVEIASAPFPAPTAKTTRAMRRKIQMVFQDPYSSFNPRHRVEKIIAEPLSLYETPPDKNETEQLVADALTAVDLTAIDAKKYPHEFSGGQRQRIAIARALITNPSVIVLDEATSALDVASRNRVLELLMRLSDEKAISYLFITHDLSIVRNITDRVLVMKAGKIVEEGATRKIFTQPKHPYTRKLLAAAPVMNRHAFV